MHQSMPYWVLSVLLTCACAAAATELTDMLGSVGLLSVGPRRNLLQSDICGAQEYFCGETDMVLDTAYNAVVAGNCYNDTADTGQHQSCCFRQQFLLVSDTGAGDVQICCAT